MNALKIGLGLLFPVVFATVCSLLDIPQKADGEPAPIVGNSESKSTSHLFDGTKAKAGDRIANMTVVKTNAAIAETMPEYGPIGTVEFDGEATVSGIFEYVKEHEFLGEAFIFTVDEESVSNLPKLQNDERTVWFVLENFEEAKSMFGNQEGKGKATIIIDDYVIRYDPKETYNSARLIKIVEMKKEAVK